MLLMAARWSASFTVSEREPPDGPEHRGADPAHLTKGVLPPVIR